MFPIARGLFLDMRLDKECLVARCSLPCCGQHFALTRHRGMLDVNPSLGRPHGSSLPRPAIFVDHYRKEKRNRATATNAIRNQSSVIQSYPMRHLAATG